MMRVDPDAEASQPRQVSQTLVEPRGVHAVAGAKEVATGEALVRLDERCAVARECLADSPREARVAPQAADVKRIDDAGLDSMR